MNYSKLDAVTSGKTRTGITGPATELSIKKVFRNPDQPRKHFPKEKIEELAESIRKHGLLQPIVVVQKYDGYVIVAGECRFRAHLLNEATTIKAIIIEANDTTIMELALIENIQRADLTDYELALHISKLWKSGRYKRKQDLAAAIGKPQSYLSKAFGALRLDPEITADLEEARREIPLSVLEELGRVKDKEVQREAYGKYLDGEITRDEIKTFKTQEPKEIHKKKIIKEFQVYMSNGHLNCKGKQGGDGFGGPISMLVSGFDVEAGKKYKLILKEL
jgi:ParB family chromosome partitioning protein